MAAARAETEWVTTRAVTFPNGTKIRAELAIQPADVMRGMKFRDSLPENEGMLFVHQKEGKYPYWMFEVKVPLDMIWMDRQHTVVQLVHKVPPCPGPQEKCLSYGGASTPPTCWKWPPAWLRRTISSRA